MKLVDKKGKKYEVHTRLAEKAIKSGNFMLTTFTEEKSNKEIMEDIMMLFKIDESRVEIRR